MQGSSAQSPLRTSDFANLGSHAFLHVHVFDRHLMGQVGEAIADLAHIPATLSLLVTGYDSARLRCFFLRGLSAVSATAMLAGIEQRVRRAWTTVLRVAMSPTPYPVFFQY